MPPVVRRVLAALLGTCVSLVGLVAVSSATGGPLTWIVTQGTSMQPQIEAGTLVVLQRRSAYEVGAVVGYRNDDLGGSVLLHRVVGDDGRTLTLKGDANSWTDGFHPRTDQVVGERLVQVPGLAPVRGLLRSPVRAGAVAGALTLLLLSSRAGRRGRRGRRPGGSARRRPAAASSVHEVDTDAVPAPRRSWGTPPAARLSRAPVPTASAEHARSAAAAVLGASLLLALGAGRLPLSAAAPGPASAEARTSFDYSGPAPRGPVYPDGAVQDGDAVFTRLLDQVAVRAVLELRPGAEVDVLGWWHLEVEESDDSGWHALVHRGRDVALLPGRQVQTVTLHAGSLRRAADAAARQTGLRTAVRRLRVRAVLDADATSGGRAVPFRGASERLFTLDEHALRPVQAEAAAPAPLVVSLARGGPGGGPVTAPLVDHLRRGALVVACLAALLLALLEAAARRDGQAALLHRRRSDLFVRTRPADVGDAPVEVAGLAELVGVADRYERLVMHWEHDRGHTYLVRDDGTSYVWHATSGGGASSAVRVPRPRAAEDGPASAVRVPRPRAAEDGPASAVPGPVRGGA